MYYPGGNATDSIWRVLASSDGISFGTPLKPQHSNPNPNFLVNQLCCIDFHTSLIIPHRLRVLLESLMLLKNSCSIHARLSKSSLKHSWNHKKLVSHLIRGIVITYLIFKNLCQFKCLYKKCLETYWRNHIYIHVSLSLSLYIYIYIYIYGHTHAHTHKYIYIWDI